MNVLVRKVSANDAVRIGEIAYQTGFFGASASRYFPDAALFADLWVGPYFSTQQKATVGFVVEVDGTVEGYIIGMSDQTQYVRAVQTVVRSRLLPGLLKGHYQRPWPGLYYLLRSALFASPHAEPALFPAHLHINLTPNTRGLRLGSRLLGAYLTELQGLGVRGVQLSTTLENRVALKLYQRAGFMLVGARRTPLWTPWLGHPAVQVVLARPLHSEL